MIKRFSEYSLATYLRCPRKFYYQYIAKIKIPKKPLSTNMLLGGIIHNVCKDFYRFKMEDRTLENLHTLFRQNWKSNPIRKLFNSVEDEKQMGQRGLAMLENFHKTFASKTPFQVESYVEYKMSDYTLYGRIDRLDAEEDGSLSIVDYKTGGYYEKEDEKEKELSTIQVRLYSVLLYGNNRMTNKAVYYYFDDNYLDTIEFTEEKIKYDNFYFYELITDIEYNKEYLPQPSSYCKYCDYYDRCSHDEIEIKYIDNPTKKFSEDF